MQYRILGEVALEFACTDYKVRSRMVGRVASLDEITPVSKARERGFSR